jgi:hypothetical protein
MPNIARMNSKDARSAAPSGELPMTRTKRRTRGLIAITSSGVIAALIHFGVAAPHPYLRAAYLICVGAGVWGLIDIALSLGAARSARGE